MMIKEDEEMILQLQEVIKISLGTTMIFLVPDQFGEVKNSFTLTIIKSSLH